MNNGLTATRIEVGQVRESPAKVRIRIAYRSSGTGYGVEYLTGGHRPDVIEGRLIRQWYPTVRGTAEAEEAGS